MAVRFSLAAVVPIIIVSILVLINLARETRKDAHEVLSLMAESVSGQVEVFLREPLVVLQNTSAMLKANPDYDPATIQNLLDLHVQHSQLFESIYILDKDGTVQHVGLLQGKENQRENYLGINLAHLPFYLTARRTNNPTWSDTFLSLISGKMSLALCLIVDERVLIGNFNIELLSNFIAHIRTDHNVTMMLVDRKGAIIIHPDPSVTARQVSINNFQIVKKGFAGEEGEHRYSFQDVDYDGSVKLIPGPGWLTIVSQPVDLTYDTVKSTAIYLVAGAIGVILLAVYFALVQSRKFSKPITEITEWSKVIAAGDYDVSLSPSPYVEVQELTNSFHGMSEAVKSREKALQMSENRFREIFNSTNEAIFIRHAQTLKFLDVNQAMLDMFGYSRKEMSEITVGELSAGDPVSTSNRAKELVNKAITDGSQVFEWKYLRKDGESFWAEVTLKSTELDGKLRILGVIRDITERKKFERQLIQSQKMEAIGTLAGGIAHDFNNILTPIHGYVEMAILKAHDTEKVTSNLTEVLKAVHRAKDLVLQILTFSRQEGQKTAPTNVGVIVKEAIKLLRSSIPSTIEIRQNIDQHCGSVMANPTHIHQVLMNLCTNAYHAMRETGGVLGVVLKPFEITASDESPQVKLTPGMYIRLEVSDTGKGMDPETLSRIFEPYFTTKDKGEGTGLGLSIVHGIIKGLDGDISVYSEVGKGSTFMVYFPAMRAHINDYSNIIQTPPQGGDECILLVDDEETVLHVEEQILKSLGYRVEAFTSPHDALERFRKKPDTYDLVMSDMTMPIMTGDLLAREIIELRPDVPVILCTGFSEILKKEEAMAIGISDYMTKPLDIIKLALTLRNLLDRKRTEA